MTPEPRPHFPYTAPRLPERPRPMTLIGAFNVHGAIVLLADRQETITDYAKWDAGKIYLHEYSGQYRVAMAGAGSPEPINQIWEELWNTKGSMLTSGFSVDWPQFQDLKELIIRTVNRVTKKTIFPVPANERPGMDLIWVIQPLGQSALKPPFAMELFTTHKLSVNSIRQHYFTGNPILLAKYLSNMYLDNLLFTADEAEALAAYILWEAKEYDPTVGKHSDIFIFRQQGTLSRMTLPESEYWEEHFKFLKNSMRVLPILSCSSSTARSIYDKKDYLGRLAATVKTLAKEQEQMRKDKGVQRSKLERKLIKNLLAVAQKGQKPKKSRIRL